MVCCAGFGLPIAHGAAVGRRRWGCDPCCRVLGQPAAVRCAGLGISMLHAGKTPNGSCSPVPASKLCQSAVFIQMVIVHLSLPQDCATVVFVAQVAARICSAIERAAMMTAMVCCYTMKRIRKKDIHLCAQATAVRHWALLRAKTAATWDCLHGGARIWRCWRRTRRLAPSAPSAAWATAWHASAARCACMAEYHYCEVEKYRIAKYLLTFGAQRPAPSAPSAV